MAQFQLLSLLKSFCFFIIFLEDAFQNIMIKSPGRTLPQISEIAGVILSLYFTNKNIKLNLLYVALIFISLRNSLVAVDSCVCVCSIGTVYERGAYILLWTSETPLSPMKWMFFISIRHSFFFFVLFVVFFLCTLTMRVRKGQSSRRGSAFVG